MVFIFCELNGVHFIMAVFYFFNILFPSFQNSSNTTIINAKPILTINSAKFNGANLKIFAKYGIYIITDENTTPNKNAYNKYLFSKLFFVKTKKI